jgi:hypothetical protein
MKSEIVIIHDKLLICGFVKTFETLAKLGLCVSRKTLTKCINDLRKDYDIDVVTFQKVIIKIN